MEKQTIFNAVESLINMPWRKSKADLVIQNSTGYQILRWYRGITHIVRSDGDSYLGVCRQRDIRRGLKRTIHNLIVPRLSPNGIVVVCVHDFYQVKVICATNLLITHMAAADSDLMVISNTNPHSSYNHYRGNNGEEKPFPA